MGNRSKSLIAARIELKVRENSWSVFGVKIKIFKWSWGIIDEKGIWWNWGWNENKKILM